MHWLVLWIILILVVFLKPIEDEDSETFIGHYPYRYSYWPWSRGWSRLRPRFGWGIRPTRYRRWRYPDNDDVCYAFAQRACEDAWNPYDCYAHAADRCIRKAGES